MSDVQSKRIEEIAAYDGPHAIPGIRFRSAAKALGVTAWGMNVMELDAGCDGYPEHDHAKDGQEEVYVVVGGGGLLRAGETDVPLVPGTLVRVGPSEKRKILPGPDGLVILALGATPGKAYQPR